MALLHLLRHAVTFDLLRLDATTKAPVTLGQLSEKAGFLWRQLRRICVKVSH